MKQVAKNLTDYKNGFLNGKRYLLMDRDGKFCPAFREIVKDAGTNPVQLPPKSPNLNVYIERFMRSIKSECLGKMIFFGEKSLRNAVGQYLVHYHTERNHQGLGNAIVEAGEEVATVTGRVHCRERLGGMLHYYYREAA